MVKKIIKMRKVFLFFALLAGLFMMSGCQKEQNGVTLKAYIDRNTKLHIGTIDGNNYPFWNDDDLIKINGVEYQLKSESADRTFAIIEHVQGDAPYYAVYPSRSVTTMDIVNGTATITVPLTQNYMKDNQGNQRVNMPMAASTSSDVLHFKNLCSIIKVKVINKLPREGGESVPLDVERIIVTAENSSSPIPISGEANVNIAAGSLTMVGTTNQVILTGEYNNAMETLPNYEDEHEFYILVAPFSGQAYIQVETTTGKHYKVKADPASVEASHMATITLEVDRLVGGGDAHLATGTTVNAVLRNLVQNNDNVASIRFMYTTPLNGYTEAELDAMRIDDRREGGIPIYACLSNQVLFFYTMASHIYANPNSSYLFANLNIVNINGFDANFITDNVTNMEYMFANNNKLGGIYGIETFNTSHVTTMAHMFENNTAVSGLNLSYFNTSSLSSTGMVGMFNGCIRLQELNLSSFHTENITNMDYLFYHCLKLSDLKINNFDMSNVTSKTDMCKFLGNPWDPDPNSPNYNPYSDPNSGVYDANIPVHTQNNRVVILCPTEVVTPISTETSLNPAIVNFNNVLTN